MFLCSDIQRTIDTNRISCIPVLPCSCQLSSTATTSSPVSTTFPFTQSPQIYTPTLPTTDSDFPIVTAPTPQTVRDTDITRSTPESKSMSFATALTTSTRMNATNSSTTANVVTSSATAAVSDVAAAPPTSSDATLIGAILGSIGGTLVFVGLVAVVVILVRRRNSKRRRPARDLNPVVEPPRVVSSTASESSTQYGKYSSVMMPADNEYDVGNIVAQQSSATAALPVAVRGSEYNNARALLPGTDYSVGVL
jgi:hypothetical protein